MIVTAFWQQGAIGWPVQGGEGGYRTWMGQISVIALTLVMPAFQIIS